MSRKDDHAQLAFEQFARRGLNDYDQMTLVHHSLRSIDYADVDLTTTLGSLRLEYPFYINAMTGGSDWTRSINEKLAELAKRTGLAMAVGSMSAAMQDPSLWDSFQIVREVNPDGLIFANLNANYTASDAQTAIDRLQANALQIHVNAAQEIVMAEGDRAFSHWPQHIEEIVEASPVDVIVKEVGFGMSRETIVELMARGVRIIDVSGRGGTNFAQIENDRLSDRPMAYLNSWGQSTVQSLLEARSYREEVDLVASGGIRHPLDFIKSFVLGAKAIAMAGPFLHLVLEHGVDHAVEQVEAWKHELRLLMALLGTPTLADLQEQHYILSADLLNYRVQRGV